MFFCRKKQIVNKDKIVFLSKQFILCLFQFENCVFRSESVAKSDKLSYNEKRKRGIFLLLFWRRSSKVRIGVYFMKEPIEKNNFKEKIMDLDETWIVLFINYPSIFDWVYNLPDFQLILDRKSVV